MSLYLCIINKGWEVIIGAVPVPVCVCYIINNFKASHLVVMMDKIAIFISVKE